MNDNETSMKGGVMDAIHKGKVQMRPRWHFVLLSVLALVGTLILFLTLLYVSSLGIFFLRDSGVWFAPSFGVRGWWDLLRGIPWVLVLLVILFILVLELLVRRYAFVYKKPLFATIFGIFLLVLLGGFVLSRTSLHSELDSFAHHGMLPPPMDFLYGQAMRMPPPGELYRGTIISMNSNGFTISDYNRGGTMNIVVTPHTRLPYGGDFSVGESVVVVGDAAASGTIQAFGVRDIDD